MRRQSPCFRDSRGIRRSVAFEYLNCGKRSVAIDTNHHGDQSLVNMLLASCDVVICSAESKALVPAEYRQLVACCSAYGVAPAKGAYRSTPLTRLHASGNGYLIPPDPHSKSRPAMPGYLTFECMTGVGLALAIASSVLMKRLGRVPTDAPQEIDLTHQAYGVWLEKMFVHLSALRGQKIDRQTHAYMFGGNLQCNDGHVCIFVTDDRQWPKLCRMIEHADWLDDPRFRDGRARSRVRHEIDRALSRWCRKRSVSEVISAARIHDMPAAKVTSPRDVLSNSTMRQRGFLVPVPRDPKLLLGLPFGISTPTGQGQAPMLGEHTYEALCAAGLTDAEIRSLDTRGSVHMCSLSVADSQEGARR
jgi:crotonobetainyl-CoA:carnitine CoA-transferase CaiB-like acyl-CoA transferase